MSPRLRAALAKRRTMLPAKKERRLSHHEKRGETRFVKFLPYHVFRNGRPRLGEYAMRHCNQSVRDCEAIERFFHAQKMVAAGYAWSSNPGHWVNTLAPDVRTAA